VNQLRPSAGLSEATRSRLPRQASAEQGSVEQIAWPFFVERISPSQLIDVIGSLEACFCRGNLHSAVAYVAGYGHTGGKTPTSMLATVSL
jgi:hypothetical protein